MGHRSPPLPVEGQPFDTDTDLRSPANVQPLAAARVGFLPLPLEDLVLAALAGIPIYLHTLAAAQQFTLYCSARTRFTESLRRRLLVAGVRFIYIPMEDQSQFQRQLESALVDVVNDPRVALSTKTNLVYQTSLALIDDVLTETGLPQALPRLGHVARSVSTLVINDDQAFAQFFAAAQHDFYTATHMVNVGIGMTALAYVMGTKDSQELSSICAAGMLHDVGKLFVPEHLLNKTAPLTDAEWTVLRSHSQRGFEHLRAGGVYDEIILRVALEHHERIDASGYPRNLRGPDLHPVSRICAVVDSFDAMTAFRPFKNEVKSIAKALGILDAEAGTKYDLEAVHQWTAMMRRANPNGLADHAPEPEAPSAERLGRRRHPRHAIRCPARIWRLHQVGQEWLPRDVSSATAHNISEGGIALLCAQPLFPPDYVRIQLSGKGTLNNKIMEGQVVRFRPYQDGYCDVGVRFCSPGEQEAASRNAATQPPGPDIPAN